MLSALGNKARVEFLDLISVTQERCVGSADQYPLHLPKIKNPDARWIQDGQGLISLACPMWILTLLVACKIILNMKNVRRILCVSLVNKLLGDWNV
jgi:hypothetical protein